MCQLSNFCNSDVFDGLYPLVSTTYSKTIVLFRLRFVQRIVHDCCLSFSSVYLLCVCVVRWQEAGPNSRGDFAGGKGTGGTPVLDFLKPLKDDARASLLK